MRLSIPHLQESGCGSSPPILSASMGVKANWSGEKPESKLVQYLYCLLKPEDYFITATLCFKEVLHVPLTGVTAVSLPEGLHTYAGGPLKLPALSPGAEELRDRPDSPPVSAFH